MRETQDISRQKRTNAQLKAQLTCTLYPLISSLAFSAAVLRSILQIQVKSNQLKTSLNNKSKTNPFKSSSRFKYKYLKNRSSSNRHGKKNTIPHQAWHYKWLDPPPTPHLPEIIPCPGEERREACRDVRGSVLHRHIVPEEVNIVIGWEGNRWACRFGNWEDGMSGTWDLACSWILILRRVCHTWPWGI